MTTTKGENGKCLTGGWKDGVGSLDRIVVGIGLTEQTEVEVQTTGCFARITTGRTIVAELEHIFCETAVGLGLRVVGTNVASADEECSFSVFQIFRDSLLHRNGECFVGAQVVGEIGFESCNVVYGCIAAQGKRSRFKGFPAD